jgi:cytochrome c oxidase subunit 2
VKTTGAAYSNGRCALIAASAILLAGCNADLSALNTQGAGARRIATLWWWEFGIGTAVYVLVMAFLVFALFRGRRRGLDADPYGTQDADEDAERTGTRIVLFGGIIAPAIILFTVFGMTVGTLNALSTPDIPEEYTVHVVGRQWWWKVRYPHHGFETANEIHIPTGQPVRIVLSSEDVIHSFWVPELHGKLDLVPGMTNEMWIEADEPGVYIGQCAEYCGTQHANMRFLIIAEPAESYEAWTVAQQQPAPEPTDSLAVRGRQIFLNSTCVTCHTIAGTHATGNLGPDLTHLAGRRTLAAATVPNNRGYLGGWILDPQHTKPGSLMPATPLTGDDLQALLAYLETLE